MSELNDQQVEDEIQAKGLTAPRVTIEEVKQAIAAEYYFTAAEGVEGAELMKRLAEAKEPFLVDPAWSRETKPNTTLGLLTFCVLILNNGIKVTGESACISAENYDEMLGRKIARDNAVSKVWQLLGMRLADKLKASDLDSQALR